MIYPHLPVISVESVGTDIFVLTLHAPQLGALAAPGQFLNIRVEDTTQPLLRRPFSIYKVDGGEVSIIFNVVGIGTRILAARRPGESLDVMGPLGQAFSLTGDFSTAILVGGGLGVAALPMLTDALVGSKKLLTFVGARTAGHIVGDYLQNVMVATDDGSAGTRGTVTQLLEAYLADHHIDGGKVFACGPTPMLKSLQQLSARHRLPCEVSLESVMACGIGICQGCPVRRKGVDQTFSLICKEGPVFDVATIQFD